MVILDAKNLCKAFGAVTAANRIDAAIEKDSVVGLIGTNGAGKTTFINMITGYLKPDAGAIRFEGRDITRLPPREITRLGICRSFQIPQLYRSLTVSENMLVALGVVLRNAGRGGFFSRGRPQVPGYDAPAEEAAERILERGQGSDLVHATGDAAPRKAKGDLHPSHSAFISRPAILSQSAAWLLY
jgi:ABC-type branched-subunit amino acid transport system ATPase component